VNFPLEFWSGKQILAICGGKDRLVPPKESGTIDFVDELRAHGMGDRVQLKIDESAGHEVTPLMIQWITEWIWENALKE
jgi:predicted esterase